MKKKSQWNRMGRAAAIGLCTALMAGCASGSGGNVQKEGIGQDDTQLPADAPAWQRLAETGEDITLDWYINYSWFATKWGENVVSTAITEETGVSVNFITPMGNEVEKLNALIAMDALPDLITLGYWEPQLDDMIGGDMVYALNELADQYDAYFWEVTDPTVVNWYTQENGNIYSYPNSSISPQEFAEHENIGSNECFLVRRDIYEAIGSPNMSTQEGFHEAVKRAKEMFPKVDGQPLIPIGAHYFDETGNVSFDTYLMNFLAIDQERGGKVYDRYTDPEYVSWLKLFRQLGEEGYLANDIFVDTRTQMEEKIEQGRYFCMLYQYADMLTQQKTLYAKNPKGAYIAVEGPRNTNGANPQLPVSSINGWTVTLISKNCRDPERAIAFIDYLLSEHGQMITYLGVEGKTYEMADGKPMLFDEVKELLDTDRLEYDRIYGADSAYWMFQNNVMQLQWEQETAPAVRQLKEWSYKYAIYNGQYDFFFPSGTEESVMDTRIKKAWGDVLPQLLLAPTEEEFDRLFAAFVEEREHLGFDELMEIKTRYMAEAKEKLGIAE